MTIGKNLPATRRAPAPKFINPKETPGGQGAFVRIAREGINQHGKALTNFQKMFGDAFQRAADKAQVTQNDKKFIAHKGPEVPDDLVTFTSKDWIRQNSRHGDTGNILDDLA